MNIKCPICGGPYTVSSTNLVCNQCHYIVRDSKFIEVMNEAPRFIRDSVRLMEMVLSGKVLLSYGPHQIFEKEFNLNDTIIVPIDAICVGNYLRGDMKVLISLGKAFSKFYIQDLNNGIKLCAQVNPTLRDNHYAGSLILQWSCYEKPVYAAAEEQALSAYVAPTWLDAANAVMYRCYTSITKMTESEIFYNVLSCNKAAVVQDFRSPLGISDKLAKHIVHLAKFCDKSNLRACVPDASVNSFLTGANFKRAVTAVVDSLPELITSNSDTVFNNFLFGTSECVSVQSTLLRDIDNDDKLRHLESNAKLFRKLWETFGRKVSFANAVCYTEEVRYKMHELPSTMPEVVMAYWNIISKKLEEKYE